MFQCDTCQREYKYKKNLSRHMMEKHHPDYEHWNCSMCKRKFIRREYLFRHLQKIHGLDKVTSIKLAMDSTRGDTNQQSSYYEDINVNNNESQDDNIGQLLKESDSQSSKEEQSAENMETDANDQEDNISVITVSDEELCEDNTVGRSGTYVRTIMIFMRKRTHYINGEETGSTYDVVNDYFEHFE
ncbi:unnamed protein product [Mytilus edulis]|uniref:C2H2-type domain-containing protein n=1 Tax=Mytilus edulis TaxID=6550 RepID=A0A8S3RJV4_MYTED|nr:unnamed protein product [Mytilus edulis]